MHVSHTESFIFILNAIFKGAMSRYFGVFRRNLYLILSLKLKNGKVEFLTDKMIITSQTR